MAVVALVGTLDTKGAEYTWLAERLVELGTQCLLVDAGVVLHQRSRRRHLR